MSVNILHRLTVRKSLLLSGFFSSVISREKGTVEATFKATAENKTPEQVQALLAAHGFGFSLLSTGLNDEGQTVVEFTNPVMQEQLLWGARGMSKTARAAMGIGTLVQVAPEPVATPEPEPEPEPEPVAVPARQARRTKRSK